MGGPHGHGRTKTLGNLSGLSAGVRLPTVRNQQVVSSSLTAGSTFHQQLTGLLHPGRLTDIVDKRHRAEMLVALGVPALGALIYLVFWVARLFAR